MRGEQGRSALTTAFLEDEQGAVGRLSVPAHGFACGLSLGEFRCVLCVSGTVRCRGTACTASARFRASCLRTLAG
eukprot:scaffold781_cov123-Isochrysis_galbana.AAC.3